MTSFFKINDQIGNTEPSPLTITIVVGRFVFGLPEREATTVTVLLFYLVCTCIFARVVQEMFTIFYLNTPYGSRVQSYRVDLRAAIYNILNMS